MFVGFILLLTCMGLCGLAAFDAERRFKEIGIRKVLGAPSLNIALMLIKDFSMGAILANIIAWPLAYLLIDQWLQRFAYKMNFSIWLFVVSGFTVLLITWITVSYHTLKAATTNPVESLKYE
jgi:putative ABC transport system permease protein